MSTNSTDGKLDPIFTHKVQSDKRSFFFNVKKSAAGELYLTVSQFARVADEWVRLKMVIPAEDAKPFYQGLCEAIRAMRDAESASAEPAQTEQAKQPAPKAPARGRATASSPSA